MTAESHRGSIYLEDARILAQAAYPGDQHVMRLAAPLCARLAKPGTFVHVQCAPLLPLRRPLSIMRTSPGEGWIELLYKVVGQGTRQLGQHAVGETLSLVGPIGVPFQLHTERPRPLLLGGGVGMPPIIFLAQQLRWQRDFHPLVLLASEVPFPFAPRPSQILVPGLPAGVIAGMPLLDDWNIPSRLASRQEFAGCHPGLITDLADVWLRSLDTDRLAQVELFACGPHPMLRAVARLGRMFGLPCQVSLEEFMACGVGGCAGCVVEVETPRGRAMQRVCVDGPVFDGYRVFPADRS